MEFFNTLYKRNTYTCNTYKKSKPYKKKTTSNIKNKKIFKLLDKIILYKRNQILSELVLCFKSK